MCECTDNALLARFIICVFACLLFVISPSSFAATIGDVIDSDAEVHYQSNGQSLSKIDGAPFVLQSAGQGAGGIGTNSAIDIWAPYVPTNTSNPIGSKIFNTEVSQCLGTSENSNNIINTDIKYPNGDAITFPASISSFPSTTFKSGNPLIIRVIDLDQNINSTIRDQVSVSLKVDGKNSDHETVILTETSNNSGEFIGIVQTTPNLQNSNPNDCLLALGSASALNIEYQDENDGEDTVSSIVKFDPISRVFDSFTGTLLDNIEITLIDNNTGLPATVYGDDGISDFPATITSGSLVSDSSGKTYQLPSGGYRFPYVPNGNYSIQIADTVKTEFPSQLSEQTIQALPTGPYLLSGISRGESFTISNKIFDADIPLDPKSDRILLDKTASKNEAGVGDFVAFNISVNNAESFASNIRVIDTLPVGLTYVKNSLVVAGNSIIPASISNDGRIITIDLPDMEANEKLILEYVTQVSATADGLITNEAVAIHSELKSNIAKASIQIKDDLYRNKARLFGRVILDGCEGNLDLDADGIAGVRLYMEDGSYVVTDNQGEWHIEGVKPGTHVLQLDTETIPDYLEVVECKDSFFHAGQSYSQFVDLQPGSFWRADFHLRVKKALEGEVKQSLQNELVPLPKIKGDTATNITTKTTQSPVDQMIRYQIRIEGHGVPLTDVQEFVLLPAGIVYQENSLLIDGLKPTVEYHINDNSLLIKLGDKPEKWQHDIEFNGLITAKAVKGKLTAKAKLFYKTGLPNSLVTPDAQSSALLYLPPADGKADPLQPPRFGRLSETLSLQDKRNLADVIDKLKGLQNLEISVSGHTDSTPVAQRENQLFSDNQALSVARALSVANYLSQQLSLPLNQIKVSGHGSTKPIASNSTVEGRASNRRVEVRVLNADARIAVATITADTRIAKTESLIGGINTTAATAASLKSNQVLEPVQIKPTISENWFRNKSIETNWVWPTKLFNPTISATDIIIQHPQNTRLRLTLNGVPVHGVYYEGMTRSKTRPIAVSEWRGIEIEEGANQFVAEVLNREEEVIDYVEHNVHFAGAPANIEFLPELSYTYADGIQPAVIAIKFTDKDGYPVRPNSNGLVQVSTPYQLLQTNEYDYNPLIQNNKPVYQVEQDGIAFIELQPSSQSGEVRLSFEHANGLTDDIGIWLKPAARDWLLVGLGDLTLGHNSTSANSSALSNGSIDENIYHDGRIAFFAKGQIPGDFLLTAAYDSAKEQTTPFATLVQPGEYYTLYADASNQGNDASSGDKLFLKIEKERFYALFGDLSTGLNKTQLGQYVRSLTGVQVAYLGDLFELTAFASETDLGFVRDEIQGNGTSGLYQLSSKFIVDNSDRIVIETRDRFQSEIIIKSQELTRHLDYSLDQQSGTLYFKSPIATTDNDFNPIFIVANYETQQADSGHVMGGRGGIKFLNDKVKAGVTVIEESSPALDSQLAAVDAEVNIGDWTFKAEVAQTQRSTTTDEYSKKEANAQRAEAVYRSGKVEVNTYIQRIEDEFGLEQQNAGELDQQKVGISTSFYVTDHDQVSINTFYQETLSTGLEKQQAEADWTHKLTNISSLTAGARTAIEETADGPRFVDEISFGANWSVFSQKLRLNAKVTTDVSTRSEDNDRLRLGADYRWTDSLSTFVDYERSFNDSNLERTTIGLRTQPWQGGQVEQSFAQEQQDDGYRLYSVSGLSHDWQVSEHWLVSFGYNQSRNLADAFPTESQSSTEDFNAISTGWAYRAEKLQWTNRIERRNGTQSETTLLHTSLYHPLTDAIATGGSINYYLQNDQQGEAKNWDATFDLALRPRKKDIAILLQTRLLQDNKSTADSRSDSRKFINNIHVNWMITAQDQLATQYGFKRILDQYNSKDYAGTTNYLAAEWRHNFTQKWDLGMHGRELFAGSAAEEGSYGFSVGYTPVKNLWTSIGYNFEGFVDSDFSAANYTSQGVYLKMRFKADQDSLSSLRQAFNW
ncbi:MAG: OmpA family protein [Oleispira sp.]|nr:OmpA family protein [Oleispira sp.]